jgi:hypothetical protein
MDNPKLDYCSAKMNGDASLGQNRPADVHSNARPIGRKGGELNPESEVFHLNNLQESRGLHCEDEMVIRRSGLKVTNP